MSAREHFDPTGYLVYRAPSIFDTDAAAEMIDDLMHATASSPYLAIDMRGVQLMTSAAVTVLLWAHRRTKTMNGQMVLVAVPHGASATIAVAGASEVFQRVRHLGEAAPVPGRHMQTA